MTLICATTALCPECGVLHDAVIEREGNELLGQVSCPSRGARVRLSSDAEMSLALRRRSRCIGLPPPAGILPLVSLLPVTNDCNYRCPICYADAAPTDSPQHLTTEEFMSRLRQALRLGVRSVTLTGGEPTLHPELTGLVRAARRCGLRVCLATNGLRLAEEPRLAVELKRAGLSKVSLQLDSFNPATHQRQRGNTLVATKEPAARAILAAGLRLGTITTVTTLNLRELGDIIRFGLSLGPSLQTMVFQAAAAAGRFELPAGVLVDKEQILHAMIDSDALPGVSLDDVWPLPHFEPWRMRVHPDCAVNIIGAVNDGRFTPVGRWLDTAGLYARLTHSTPRRHWVARNVVPGAHFLASMRLHGAWPLVRATAGFVSGRGRQGLLVIGVGAFCSAGFVDTQRLDGCATVELTDRGPISPCRGRAVAPVTART
jgi:hypothetical protein